MAEKQCATSVESGILGLEIMNAISASKVDKR
jgi:hypothetical protein